MDVDTQDSLASTRSRATIGIALFLLTWSFVEDLVTIRPKNTAPPGTTFNAAKAAGAAVTPSTAPSALETPLIPPGPVEALQERKRAE